MKYRIVNRTRFITFLVIAILLMYFLIAGLASIVFASDNGLRETAEVRIVSGDTLWDIAKEYGPRNQDIRKTVYDICVYNGIKAGEIYPGQVIYIPAN